MVYQYFMVGAMGALTAAGAKATVQGLSFSCQSWIRNQISDLRAGYLPKARAWDMGD